jgi:hypothetical protein
VREIRTLRAMWRALETEPRQVLNGHEEGNLGHKPRRSLRAAAPALDPTRHQKRQQSLDGTLWRFAGNAELARQDKLAKKGR